MATIDKSEIIDKNIGRVVIDNVEIPLSGITPSGTLNITENGKYNVTNYASANVNVAGGEDMLQAMVDATNSCCYLFYEYSGSSLDFINKLNTSDVTNMDYMFSRCQNVLEIDLTSFDVSKVKTMEGMFKGKDNFLHKITKIKFGNNFNSSNVTNMSNMFRTLLFQADPDIDFYNLKTNSVTDMSYMFNTSYFTTLDLTGFNTEEVKNMGYMFLGCSKLISLNISSFNTQNTTNMTQMFRNCSALTSLDLSNFNTSNVTNMSNMFSNCGALTSLDLSSFDTSNVTNMSSMFKFCITLTDIDLSSFDTSSVTTMSNMFSQCSKLTNIIGELDAINATSMTYIFANCYALTTFTLKNIKKSLTIGSGTSYGTLLDDPTIINTAKELWDKTAQTLTVSTPTSARLDAIYVKLIEATEEMIANDPYITSKKPCEVCQSTDEGAMTLREYIVSKNWTISG